VIEALRALLATDSRIAYALLFGSGARGTSHPQSDIDIALELRQGIDLSPHDLGELASRIEAATGHPVDLVLLNEAPPALAYRVFRDGTLLVEHDRAAFVARKARAILEYLDFRWVEQLCAEGVLAAARRGR
jgi:hypothetical protein